MSVSLVLQSPFPIKKKQTPLPHEEGNGLPAESEWHGYGYTKVNTRRDDDPSVP